MLSLQCARMRIKLLFLIYLQFRGGWGGPSETLPWFYNHPEWIVQRYYYAIDCNIASTPEQYELSKSCEPQKWGYQGKLGKIFRYTDPGNPRKETEPVYATKDNSKNFPISIANPVCCTDEGKNNPLCPYCYKYTYQVGKRCGVFMEIEYIIGTNPKTYQAQKYTDAPQDYCSACRQVDCVTECRNGQVRV
jgi:hypothetical protein